MHAAEIAIDERIPRLRLLARALGETEMPSRELLPRVRLEERVLLTRARLHILPARAKHIPARIDQPFRVPDRVVFQRVAGHARILTDAAFADGRAGGVRYRLLDDDGAAFSVEPSSPWLWESMVGITLVLVLLNVLLIVLVHGRRIRQYLRGGRERRFQEKLDEVMARLDHPTGFRDRVWLRWELAGFDELERPLAAVALIERLRPASAEEREQMLEVLREVGAVELLVDSTGSRIPWRRALAVRTLGWAGAEEAVPC